MKSKNNKEFDKTIKIRDLSEFFISNDSIKIFYKNLSLI
jgi:hypothetical protein